jgi:MEMO1 family protein
MSQPHFASPCHSGYHRPMALPALRNIDASPVEHEGQQLILIRDPEGYVEEQLVLTPLAFFIATCLDGKNELSDVQYHLFTQTQTALDEDRIREVIDYLDEQGFLHSERFEPIRKEIDDAYAALATRPANLADKSYPADPDELQGVLNGLFEGEDGPGELPGATDETLDPVRCLVVPHIDFDRGGHVYAHGYLRLAKGPAPITVIIFGVAHTTPPVPFILTRKGFDTPLGTLKTDTAMIDRLAAACGWDPFEHEMAHRTEHSIEFQAVMLAHLYGSDVRIVPILCGAFSDDPTMDDPSKLPHVAAFLNACKEEVRAADGSVCVIAGVDLSHVGKRFGDPIDIDEAIIDSVAARDMEDLAHAMALDPEAWYASVMRDQNARHVCGLNAIYAALKSTDGTTKPGELLKYDSAPDPAGGIVSFAGIAFSG